MPNDRVRLTPDKAIPAALRRRYLRLAAAAARTETRARKARLRTLRGLSNAYRKELGALMGREGERQVAALRRKVSSSSRAGRLRASHALLSEIGFDRAREDRLRNAYFTSVRKLLDLGDIAPPVGGIALPDCSPWVEHRAPFVGEVDRASFEKQGDVSAPTFTRQLNRTTGVIRSGIRTGVSDAGGDDRMAAEHYAAFTTWHTTLETAPLEGYLVFQFSRRATYSGEVSDEFGISTAIHSQYALARLRIVTAAFPEEIRQGVIFNEIEFEHGEDETWSGAEGNVGDMHWYRFRTERVYPQGTPLILEAGILNAAWFQVDDMSISMTNDIDVRLDRIMVRSCP